MELVDGRLIFSATDLINHLECPHLTHLNIEVALGRTDLTETRSDTTDLVARKGDEHEQAYLDQTAPRTAARSSRSRASRAWRAHARRAATRSRRCRPGPR